MTKLQSNHGFRYKTCHQPWRHKLQDEMLEAIHTHVDVIP